MLLGIFDTDVTEKYLLKYPQLYNTGIRDAFFNSNVFFSWVYSATIESIFISIIPLYVCRRGAKR